MSYIQFTEAARVRSRRENGIWKARGSICLAQFSVYLRVAQSAPEK